MGWHDRVCGSRTVRLCVAARLLAEALLRGGCRAEAAARYEAVANRDDLELTAAERHDLRRWARRARFFEAHAPRACEVDITAPPPKDARPLE